jgi:hypothetical protein
MERDGREGKRDASKVGALNTFLIGPSSIAIETASTLQLSYTLLLHLS